MPTSPGPPIRFLLQWGSRGPEPGQFVFPIDIAINAADEIFISDFSNRRVQKFDTEGRPLAAFPVMAGGGGMAAGGDGQLYLSHFPLPRPEGDKLPDRVTVWSPNGEYLREWGCCGEGPGEFNYPGGIAVSPDEHVYVADQINHRIQVFDREGRFIDTWGEHGLEAGQFGGNLSPDSRVAGPQFVALDSTGCVYTTEGSVGRIQKFTADGEFLLSWGSNDDSATGFGRKFAAMDTSLVGPIGIGVDRHDCVWVSSVGGRIQQFSGEGEFLRGLGENQGTEPGEFLVPHGLAFDSRGDLYVVDTFNHRVQKFAVEL